MTEKTPRTPQDAQRVNLNEDGEVRYWTEALGVSEELLRQVVNQVGPTTRMVRRALSR
jgi:hypothetical protein